MNTRKYYLLALLSLVLSFYSCNRDEPSSTTPTKITPDATNDFVWKAMNSWYYWQPNVPNLADGKKSDNKAYTDLINGKTPDKLFYSLLYNYGTNDRFSWIENNNEIVSSSRFANAESISGLDFTPFSKGDNTSNYVAFVNYVVPNSSAANAGIKRGDIITKINGAYITANNYASFWDNSFTITRAEKADLSTVNEYYVISTTDRSESVQLTKTAVEENPIAFYKTYEMDGKKIGYLVYNSFKIDYNAKLNEKFAQMKADRVTDLILDLRYNGGGYLNSAIALGQMITGGYTGQNYIYEQYNSKHSNYNGYTILRSDMDIYRIENEYPVKTGEVQNINSINLPKIYILVSHMTASASELTAICLEKYINVETIGYDTTGKFVGSHTLYDSPNNDYINYENRNKSHNWKLQPITFEYYNKNKDAHPKNANGKETIVPKNRTHPFEWINRVKEFGEITDPELNKALSLILGRSVSRTTKRAANLNYEFKTLHYNENPAKGLIINDFNNHIKRMKK